MTPPMTDAQRLAYEDIHGNETVNLRQDITILRATLRDIHRLAAPRASVSLTCEAIATLAVDTLTLTEPRDPR